MIHVMAATGLGGTAMSAPVVGYDAIAVLEEEQHLRVPIIGRQRPAVAKHDGLTFAPVLVVDLRPIFRRNCRHVMFSFAFVCLKASSDLRSQIPAVYCTGRTTISSKHGHSEQKNAMVKPYEAARCGT